MWIVAAVCSAVFAGLTTILAKCGIKKTNSDVATALRTAVVLVFSWLMVFIVGAQKGVLEIRLRSWVFLVLSGLATGVSWLCYFKALSIGDVNKVVPVDKSSTVLSVLFAIVLLGETEYLAVKLIGTALIGVGTYLMIERKQTQTDAKNKKWLVYAVFSAVFAALTSIFAKIGMNGVNSTLATAIRTVVVLIMAWVLVFLKGERSSVKNTDKKELVFIVLSGIATGCSWLCYYYALQKGVVSVVVPIDKMSIVLTVLFSCLVLKEKLSPKAVIGLCLTCVGTLAMAIWA